MIFRQLFDTTSSTYTYLLAAGRGRQAVFIDPVADYLPMYLGLLEQLDLQLAVAADTHVHADHITALGELRDATGCLSIMGEGSGAECVSRTLADGERMPVDGLEIVARATPGHTAESFSYLMSDRVFSGDTLLIRGTGRTDFQNGDAGAQYDSLMNVLLALPEDTLVYPGHDYKGHTCSSIWEEKRHNPRLQVADREAYIALMSKLKLPDPKLMDVAVPANLACGRRPD